MSLSQEPQFQKYPRLLNRVKWSTLATSRRLLWLLVDAFVTEGPLLMVHHRLCVVTRLCLDAALYDSAPPRAPEKRGRSRLKGARQPTLKARLESEVTVWRGVWYSGGLLVVPLSWVVVRDPQNTFKPQAFLCTDEAAEPEQILAWFLRRWQHRQ